MAGPGKWWCGPLLKHHWRKKALEISEPVSAVSRMWMIGLFLGRTFCITVRTLSMLYPLKYAFSCHYVSDTMGLPITEVHKTHHVI